MTIIVKDVANIPSMLIQKSDEDDSLTAVRSINEEDEDETSDDATEYFEYSNERVRIHQMDCVDSLQDDIIFAYDDDPIPPCSRSLADDDIDFEISFEDIGHEDIEDAVEVPEWFAHEDKGNFSNLVSYLTLSDQLKEIFNMYIEALDLNQVKRVREPPV
jgi:hypothetical protein